ncbi:MAG: fumarate hydratase [Candidatus Jordarchaeales archaeon]|nr:fumarate hydratase [Candidatus Jordarchaeia archaeon]
MDEEKLEKVIIEGIRKAVSTVPPDVKSALKEALKKEHDEVAKMQLEAMIENIRLAEEKKLPVCQDTGMLYFHVRLPRAADANRIRRAILGATIKATREVPLRPNAVDSITGENSGNNVGVNVPWIEVEPSDNDYVEITVFPKGGGADNASVLTFLPVGDGLNEVKSCVLKSVLMAGGGPCPPVVLGIGVGGGAYIAMMLAKMALMRPITERNSDSRVAQLENEILEEVNKTGIGPMGLGGRTTAIGVNIEVAHRHPASYPVAVLFNCYVVRRAKVKIDPEGKWWFE